MDSKTYQEMVDACKEHFMLLTKNLEETHEIVGSCNNDISMYLIPKGSIEQLSYNSKPQDSYRLSDHWNWYANLKRCSDEHYIQCYNVDMPWAKKRIADGKASKPVFGICVAYYGDDNKYHHVFGEKFDRKQRTWSFE